MWHGKAKIGELGLKSATHFTPAEIPRSEVAYVDPDTPAKILL